jgi:hypothetical protein
MVAAKLLLLFSPAALLDLAANIVSLQRWLHTWCGVKWSLPSLINTYLPHTSIVFRHSFALRGPLLFVHRVGRHFSNTNLSDPPL